MKKFLGMLLIVVGVLLFNTESYGKDLDIKKESVEYVSVSEEIADINFVSTTLDKGGSEVRITHLDSDGVRYVYYDVKYSLATHRNYIFKYKPLLCYSPQLYYKHNKSLKRVTSNHTSSNHGIAYSYRC